MLQVGTPQLPGKTLLYIPRGVHIVQGTVRTGHLEVQPAGNGLQAVEVEIKMPTGNFQGVQCQNGREMPVDPFQFTAEESQIERDIVTDDLPRHGAGAGCFP